MRALLQIARTVQRRASRADADDVEAALAAGATDADVQLAVLIAAGFSMYNRMVEGFRARTAPVTDGVPRARRPDRRATATAPRRPDPAPADVAPGPARGPPAAPPQPDARATSAYSPS